MDLVLRCISPAFLKKKIYHLLSYIGFNNVMIILQKNEKHIDIDEQELAYSFTDHKRAIHPWAIESMLTELSDSLPKHLTLYLGGARSSNEYSEKVYPIQSSQGWIASSRKPLGFADSPAETFCYRKIGKTKANIYILHTQLNGGGSGWFNALLFLELSSREIMGDIGTGKTKTIIVLNRLGSFLLGDRFEGSIELNSDDRLIINGASHQNAHEYTSYTLAFTTDSINPISLA